MRFSKAISLLAASLLLSVARLHAQDLADTARTYRPRLATNLVENIIPFWYPKTIDQTNGGYVLNHDIEGRLKGPGTKMIVTQARMVWFYSHLVRTGHGGREYLDAADGGYRFLKNKMWDQKNGGFYWEVDATGEKQLRSKKHLYGQSFALYALSEYYLASGKKEALDLATRLFNLIEAKAHDKIGRLCRRANLPTWARRT
jgi:mannobiose 2-epimerase